MTVAYTPGASLHAGSLTMTGYSSGTPGVLDDFRTADLAGTLEVWVWQFIAGSPGHATNEQLTRPLQLADYRSVTLEATVDAITTPPAYVQITGTDAMGSALVKLVAISTAGTYVEFTHAFATITKIETAGGATSGTYFRMRQKRWGVVHKIDCGLDSAEDSSMYKFECPVNFGDGSTATYFQDVRKTAFFWDKYTIKNSATVTWGEEVTVGGDTIYAHGCRVNVSREASLSGLLHILNGGVENIYDSYFYIEPGWWSTQPDAVMNIRNSTICANTYADTDADFRIPCTVSMQRVNVHGFERLHFGGASEISDLASYGNDSNLVAESFNEVWVISSKTMSANAYEVYAAKSTALKYAGRFHIVDTTFDETKVGLENVLCYMWVHFSLVITVLDSSGAAIEYAMVSLVDKNEGGKEWLIIERSGQELDGGEYLDASSFTLTNVTGLNIGDDFRVQETIHTITDITGVEVEVNNGSAPSTGSRDTPLPNDKGSGVEFADGTQVYHFYPIETDSNGKIDCSGKRAIYVQWTNDLDATTEWTYYNPFILRINRYGYRPYKSERSINKSIDTGIVLDENPFLTASEGTAATYGVSLTLDHSAGKITVTGSLSINNIYDYCQLELQEEAAQHLDDFFYTADGVNFVCEYEFEVANGVTVTATDKKLTVNHANGYDLNTSGGFTGVLEAGTTVRIPVTLEGVHVGARCTIVTDDEDFVMLEEAAGTSVTVYYEKTKDVDVGITIDVRQSSPPGTIYKPWETTGTLRDSAYSLEVNQVVSSVGN
ncbi:MAG: hypothetical protein ABIK28_25200 [Planctomycetota bacterium]